MKLHQCSKNNSRILGSSPEWTLLSPVCFSWNPLLTYHFISEFFQDEARHKFTGNTSINIHECSSFSNSFPKTSVWVIWHCKASHSNYSEMLLQKRKMTRLGIIFKCVVFILYKRLLDRIICIHMFMYVSVYVYIDVTHSYIMALLPRNREI